MTRLRTLLPLLALPLLAACPQPLAEEDAPDAGPGGEGEGEGIIGSPAA